MKIVEEKQIVLSPTARMIVAIPNLMKDCHQVSKCFSDPKVRVCLYLLLQNLMQITDS